MARFSHLSLSERITLQSLLPSHKLGAIAKVLGRDRHTIVREILANRTFVYRGAANKKPNNCARISTCKRRAVCPTCVRTRAVCSLCGLCNEVCPDFLAQHCQHLEHPPFCCNGCSKHLTCTFKRYFYHADKAHAKSCERIRDSRIGLFLTPAELAYTDQLVSPLLRQGQSIHHVFLSHRDELFCSEKTLYTLINARLLHARNIDLPRKVRRRPPPKKRTFKVDRACRQNRTFEDYQRFLADCPDLIATQMDSVLPGQDGHKVFLTLFWPQAQFLLAFLRDYNTAHSVMSVFDDLDQRLGRETFRRLFPLLLTDNGSEFSNPSALERDGRTRIFFCDPLQSNQKSQIERSHEFIRMILPKGSLFDNLTQVDCDLICSHINSYRRDSLQGKSPVEAFAWLYGQDVLDALHIRKINADEVTLTPRLLRQLI